jgi:hypothetical protein
MILELFLPPQYLEILISLMLIEAQTFYLFWCAYVCNYRLSKIYSMGRNRVIFLLSGMAYQKDTQGAG